MFFENHRDQYIAEMREQPDQYKTTIADFKEWLVNNNYVEDFKKAMRFIDNDEFFVAVDYGIPVSMVKYFKIHNIAQSNSCDIGQTVREEIRMMNELHDLMTITIEEFENDTDVLEILIQLEEVQQ